MENGQAAQRLAALERWRDTVDAERGTIMGEMGRFGAVLEAIKEQSTGFEGRFDRFARSIETRLAAIEDKLEERPSRAEFMQTRRDVDSIRAKAKWPRFSRLEVEGPANLKFRLWGVSGVTIVLALLLIVALIALLLRK